MTASSINFNKWFNLQAIKTRTVERAIKKIYEIITDTLIQNSSHAGNGSALASGQNQLYRT